MACHAELFVSLFYQALVIRGVGAVTSQAAAFFNRGVLVFLRKAPLFGVASKTELLTLCRQKLWIVRSVGPVAGQTLPRLVRSMAVLLGLESFLILVTALAQFADFLLDQLVILRGMGVVAFRAFKLLKRLMSPLLSELFLNVGMTGETCLKAHRRGFCQSLALSCQHAEQEHGKK